MTALAQRATPARTTHHRGFWMVAFAFVVTMAGGALPSPLYVLFQAEQGFAASTLTVVFAMYAAGVLAALLLFGRLSDDVGRRRVLLPALVLAAASSALFAVADGLAALLVARALSGASVGLLTGAATAHLAELHAAARPDSGPRRAVVVATAANLGGLGVGSLLAGALAETAVEPTRLVFLVHLALLALAAVAVWLTPETASTPGRATLRPQRPALPPDGARELVAAAITAGCGFAALGLFASLAPSFLRTELAEPSLLVSGVVVFVAFASAAAAQVLMAALGERAAARAANGLLIAGLAAFVAAIDAGRLSLILLSALLTGGGAGLALKDALSAAGRLTAPGQHAGVLATVFVVAYLGLTMPVIGMGVAVEQTPVLRAVMTFAAALTAVALAAVSVRERHTHAHRVPGSAGRARRPNL
jgi:MFS family permease